MMRFDVNKHKMEKVKRITVEIPVHYLVQIAAHGKMGSGELGVFMKTWAERVCRENGLHDEVIKALDAYLKEQRKNLTNMLGEDIMADLDRYIDKGLEIIQAGVRAKLT